MSSQILSKMIIVGDAEVGKTSVAYQYTQHVFNEEYIQTIGTNFLVKEIQTGEYKVTLQIWDTAGQERFQKLLPTYYQGSHAALLVYSITDPVSFFNVKKWYDLITQHTNTPFIILVGNKADLNRSRKIEAHQGSDLASDLGVDFIEVSAKTGENIEPAFARVVTALIEQQEW